MPEYRCYMCRKVLNRTHINEERTAFVCPDCNAETMLESQDYAKLGLRPPEKDAST